MLEVAHDDRQKDFQKVGEVLHVEIAKWQELSAEGRSLTGTPSGFSDLDTITGGFQPGNLVIIAARPSMGKSALVTNIAENVSLDRERPRPVALFSLEMSEAELAQRFVASQASIKGDDLRKGRLKDESKWKRVLKVAGEYDAAPLFIDDSSDIGILDVRAKARRLHQQTLADHGGLGLIIVDYLQLLRADSRIENRVQQVGEMSRGLKILARELRCPVIALSQLSRGVESRTDKRPMLSDLRESGQIEQDADLVMFIYRDEYYNPETTDRPGRGRAHHRQAPQRRAGRRPAELPERVPALPQPAAGRVMADGTIGRRERSPAAAATAAPSASATAAASSSTRSAGRPRRAGAARSRSSAGAPGRSARSSRASTAACPSTGRR